MKRVGKTGAPSASDGLLRCSCTLHPSPRRERQTLARGVCPGSARPTLPSPGGAAQIVALALTLALTACAKPAPVKVEDDDFEVPPKEAQSDFLDIGTQAGIKWLSFVPNAERDYPELFTGLDRDQKRRLKLAPLTPADNRVLLEFNLPQGSKIWPVDWYGTELVAINLPDLPGISIALASPPAMKDSLLPPEQAVLNLLAGSRFNTMLRSRDDVSMAGTTGSQTILTGKTPETMVAEYRYLTRILDTKSGKWIIVAEWSRPHGYGIKPGADDWARFDVMLDGIKVRRELALEGSPKHKVTSPLSDLQIGQIKYPDGSISLPVKPSYLVRKIGGDSTVQLDGEGASPWLLVRQLAPTKAAGDIRVRVRNDPVFNRRLKDPQGKFSAGYDPGWNFPAVLWDYSGSGLEQYVLGVLVVGDELITLEVVSNGLRDAEARRKAKQAALDLLANSHTAPVGQRGRISTLVGWNVGTMGK